MCNKPGSFLVICEWMRGGSASNIYIHNCIEEESGDFIWRTRSSSSSSVGAFTLFNGIHCSAMHALHINFREILFVHLSDNFQ